MANRETEIYIQDLLEQITRLKDTVDFLAQHNANDVDFVYKHKDNTKYCYARYINDKLVETVLVESCPSVNKDIHTCQENNRDFLLICTPHNTYSLDKKTKKCKCIKEI